MNKFIFLLILLSFNLIKSKAISNATKKSHNNLLRKLWDENMPILPNRPSEEDDSLNHCGKSSYKYFSYIITGSPLEYSHSSSNGVRKQNKLFIKK